MPIVELKGVSKTYHLGKLEVPVLHDIDLSIETEEMAAIVGPSGSGKSTLMNLIGLLDRPSTGDILIDGAKITMTMSDAHLAHLRSSRIGFVFQSFNLLPRQSALENVLLPSAYSRTKINDRQGRAKKLLKQLGLGERAHHRPTELSGGEKQRVAIARALMNDPGIILADEPTGNLDTKTGLEVLEILKGLRDQGKTVIIVTHDMSIAEKCQRQIRVLDGRIAGATK